MKLVDLAPTVPWLSLIWLVPLVTGTLVAFLPDTRRQLIRTLGTLAAAVSCVLALLVTLGYDPGGPRYQFIEQLPWLPGLGASYLLGVDGISLAMLMLNGVVLVAAALLSWNITEHESSYWALLLLLGAGAYAVFVSLDLLVLLVCYELTLLPKVLLIGGWGTTRREYAATKLALFMMAGSALLIAGAIALYFGSAMRTFDLRLLSAHALFPVEFQTRWFLPLFLGFGILAGIVPFHGWAPTGHVAAPTAASMMLAGVMMKLGAYGCLRVAIGVLPAGAAAWLAPLAVVMALGAVLGAALAMVQRDIKFMVAYSSIGHMALALLGFVSGSRNGMIGGVLQLFAHGVLTALLFGVVGRMLYDRTHTRQMAELGGLRQVLPFAALLFTLGGLSSMGIPGFAGFWAEFGVLLGTWERFPALAMVAAISVPLTGGYTLLAISRVFFGPLPDALAGLPRLTWQERVAGAWLAAILLAVGLAPGLLTDLVAGGVAPIADALARVAPVVPLR
jgi:NADH-quinone oxidoreductase subunit M